MLKGLVAPNTIGWGQEMKRHLAYLKPGLLQVLVYEDAASQRPDLEAALSTGLPLQFDLRIYADNILTFAPRQWARECARRKDALGPGLPIRAVHPGNEFNIEGGDHKQDWAYQADWLGEFAHEWRGHSSIDLSLPALSPQIPGWEEGYKTYARQGLDGLYWYIGSHCYPGSERAYVVPHQFMPDSLISITEWNRLDPERYLAGLPDYVGDAAYFIAWWVNPEPGAPNVDLVGSDFYEGFARAGPTGQPGPEEASGYATLPEGGTMLKDQYPDLYAQWEAAGGVENNLRAHLLGIGVLKATPADLKFLADEADASITQLRAALKAFPFP